MSFKDIIKNSVLEGFNTDISTTKIVVVLGVTLFLGIYIFFVYKYKSKSNFYSKEFNIVLAGLPIITAGIVLAMQSSVVMSLGMVGALSIVRFRNAIKNPMDLLFLFWSISIGMICGSGLYEIGVVISLIMTILLFGLDLIPIKNKSYLLIINTKNNEVEEKILTILKEFKSSYVVKSRSVSNKKIDLIIEIRCKKEDELMKKCLKIKNIENISLLSHDGEKRF